MMKLKLDDKGIAVIQDGKPVYVKDDGTDVAFDVTGTLATIARLNGEAKSNRERAETTELKLKGFDGIDDSDCAEAAPGQRLPFFLPACLVDDDLSWARRHF